MHQRTSYPRNPRVSHNPQIPEQGPWAWEGSCLAQDLYRGVELETWPRVHCRAKCWTSAAGSEWVIFVVVVVTCTFHDLLITERPFLGWSADKETIKGNTLMPLVLWLSKKNIPITYLWAISILKGSWFCDFTLEASLSSKSFSCVDQTNLDLPDIKWWSRYKRLIGRHQRKSFGRLSSS